MLDNFKTKVLKCLIDFHFFYHKQYEEQWTTLTDKWKEAYAICKEEFGTYPYPQFSFIQAGEGYMEYPMCTMLEASRMDFFNTACHEFMHNYFYGIYGSDENLHHWMDEGVTCYAESRISSGGEKKSHTEEAISSYEWMRAMYPEEPIATAANHFDYDYAYYNHMPIIMPSIMPIVMHSILRLCLLLCLLLII